ncbi:KR-domain-containing protein [Bimuria novae-zelandiae CBS 107.79]|uniref:KR-domain-containing protein n=1 Tax=Bimuria novae-zelandiae CBS 107.79 TaxID=1447943 RepID=A0A6A5V1Q2_9PLEO|nr:KR-domain-containing protein [Bimuria novae-zelandiae CBS 107.79]
MLSEMQTAGVNVQCPRCDIADVSQIKAAVGTCLQTMPPVRGCIQAAMTLRVSHNSTMLVNASSMTQDALFSEMTFEQWTQAVYPKVEGTWNLHNILPSGMDLFVLLSSFGAIVGNTGQSNYCAGNTFVDAFARYRSSRGEKTVSIDLGVVLGGGFVAENEDDMGRLLRLNIFRPHTLNDVFYIMDYYCDPRLEHMSASQSELVIGFELARDIARRGHDCPTAFEQPMFQVLRQAESSQHGSGTSQLERLTFEATFKSANSASEGRAVVSEALRQKLGRVLGLPLESISLDSTLDSYGVDSLVGVELRNWLAKEAGAELAVFEILGGGTLEDIGDLVVAKSSMRPDNEQRS